MGVSERLRSERLWYHPLDVTRLDAFHGLVQDEHVRRYMMDGNVFPREWSAERVRESEALFARRSVGLWLVYEEGTDELAGFCGFAVFPSVHPDPQLVYALQARHAGRGYATEMGRTMIAQARRAGFGEIVAGVDAVNVASVRVLEKLGFERFETREGAFGPALLLRRCP